MNQLFSAIYFLPCLLCIVWTFIYSFKVKTLTQKFMLKLILLSISYFTAYAFYISPWTNYRIMAWLDMFNAPVILLMLAIDLIFVSLHEGRKFLDSRRHYLLYVPALALSSVNFFIFYLVGVDEIARFAEALDRYCAYPPGFEDSNIHLYYQFNVQTLNYVMLAYVLFIIYWCIKLSYSKGYRLGDVFRFFFCAHESTPTRVVCFLNVVTLLLLSSLVPIGGLGRSYLLNHPAVGCTLTLLLSVTLFCLAYVEYMIELPRFTLASLSHVSFASHGPAPAPEAPVRKTVEEAVDEADAEDVEVVATMPAVRSEEFDRISAALRKAIEEERVYVDPNLSIVSLAARLQTNRTTLAQVIGQAYGVNFRQLMARYRIEAAKRYMLEKPEAKQDEVALECGFLTAQTFNQKFKELVGEAPRMWIVKQAR